MTRPLLEFGGAGATSCARSPKVQSTSGHRIVVLPVSLRNGSRRRAKRATALFEEHRSDEPAAAGGGRGFASASSRRL